MFWYPMAGLVTAVALIFGNTASGTLYDFIAILLMVAVVIFCGYKGEGYEAQRKKMERVAVSESELPKHEVATLRAKIRISS